MKKVLCFLMLIFCAGSAQAQPFGISRDSLNWVLQNAPTFNIYKDNYFVVGIPLNHTPNQKNSNAKFQISFSQRLTNDIFPLNSYLLLNYSQKAFWDIFAESKPFTELNYNPSLALAAPVFRHNRLIGAATLAFEHESNGRSGEFSRSWNLISLSYQGSLRDNLWYAVKLWVPFGYKKDNSDLIDYEGYGEISGAWLPFRRDCLIIDLAIRKGCRWNWKGSLRSNISWKIGRHSNQYLGLQWYCGYAESLINYDRFVNMVRIGLIIKPTWGVFN